MRTEKVDGLYNSGFRLIEIKESSYGNCGSIVYLCFYICVEFETAMLANNRLKCQFSS